MPPSAQPAARRPAARPPAGSAARRTAARARSPARRRGSGAVAVDRCCCCGWSFLSPVPHLRLDARSTRSTPSPTGERPDDQPGTTYLIVGSDTRDGLTEEQRRSSAPAAPRAAHRHDHAAAHRRRPEPADVDPPRLDRRDPGPRHQQDQRGLRLGGPKLLVATIEQNTGIRIDDYVEIGFGGFVDVVDAVGGIEICPKQRDEGPARPTWTSRRAARRSTA